MQWQSTHDPLVSADDLALVHNAIALLIQQFVGRAVERHCDPLRAEITRLKAERDALLATLAERAVS